MSRRVVFALPALPLSGSMVAYGPPEESSLKLSSATPAARIPGGTLLRVRLDRELDTARNQAGDGFYGILETPVVFGEGVAIPRGARFRGRVANARPGGFLKGKAALAVILESFELRNRTYAVLTVPYAAASASGWKPVHLAAGTALSFPLREAVRM